MVLDVQPCVYPNTAPPPPPPQGHNKTGCQSVATSSCKLLKTRVPDAQFSPVLEEHDGVRWSSVESDSGLPYQFKGLLSEGFCDCCEWVRHFTSPTFPEVLFTMYFSLFIPSTALSLATLLPLPPQSHSAQCSFMTSPVLLFSLSVCQLLCLCSPLYWAFNTISLIRLIFQKPAFYMIIRSALCSTVVWGLLMYGESHAEHIWQREWTETGGAWTHHAVKENINEAHVWSRFHFAKRATDVSWMASCYCRHLNSIDNTSECLVLHLIEAILSPSNTYFMQSCS